jgi:predicted ATPase/DNA-binding SARP family transcriptional activator
MPPKVRVNLLGGFSVAIGGRAVPDSAWRLRKAKDLIKLLCLAPDHRMHREQLMEKLWGDLSPEAAANNLHQAVHVARRALQSSARQRVLVLSESILSLCPDGGLTVDVDEYSEVARRARAARDRNLYGTARGLYRGPLLPDDRYEDWVEPERDRIRLDHQRLLGELANLEEAAGDYPRAAEILQELLADDSADEAAHRHLMSVYALGGQRRLALRQFEVLKALLQREIGVEPSVDTKRLYEEILTGSFGPKLLEPAEPAATGRLVAKSRTPGHSHNLPVQLSSLVGREREIAELRRLLAGGRMLSLVGAGGCGKTRLAIEVAAASNPNVAGGVWLIELAALTDPSLVVQAEADVLEVREQPSIPLLDLVATEIGDRPLLLVLDNCEHLIESCARVARALLGTCPGLVVLATSREALHVQGESVFRVSGLTIPNPSASFDSQQLMAFESIRLFVQRAQAATLGFALSDTNAEGVARICHDLDGLPLAIELAASRVASLPVEVIADRLSDRFQLLAGSDRTAPDRQQTLKSTLDWSYNLLGESERFVLRSLSVFVGGASLDAAEAVCAESVQPAFVAALVGQLVEKSLVVFDDDATEPRFRLLETVREYARDRLLESGDRSAANSRHAAWCDALVESAVKALPRPERNPWLARLEVEHDNIRAALDHCLSADPTRALRIAAGMSDFWLWRAFLTEGRRRLDQALVLMPERIKLRARALLGAATLCIRSGDLQAAEILATESLSICKELDDSKAACRALHVLMVGAWSADALTAARQLLEESLDRATSANWGPGQAAALHALGVISWYVGDETGATESLERSLTLFESLSAERDLAPPMLDMGEILVPQPQTESVRMVFEETFAPFQDVPCPTAVGYVMANRGMIARAAGDAEKARTHFESSLDRFQVVGDERAIGQALARLGNLAISQRDFAPARDLLEESLAVRRRIGDARGITLTEAALGNLATAEGDYSRAHQLLEGSVATFQRRGDMWGYAAALGNLANLALVQGDLSGARRLLEASLAAMQRIGRPRWIGWVLVQLAAITRLSGEELEARELELRALDTFRRIGDNRGVQYCTALAPA